MVLIPLAEALLAAPEGTASCWEAVLAKPEAVPAADTVEAVDRLMIVNY